jgi:flagellar biogenesis protein FliO
LAVLAVGFGGAVVGANAILTKSLALTRTAREWLAIALFLAVVIILAWVLRRLQAKRLI